MTRRLYATLLLLLPGLSAPLFATPTATLTSDHKAPYITQKVIVTLALGKIDRFSSLKVDPGDTSGFILVTPDLSENNAIADNMGIIERGPTFQFLLYPQKSGTLTLGPFALSYEIPPSLGQEARSVQTRTKALHLEIRRPPGAPNGAFVLVTPALTVHSHYRPDVARLKVGDAIERRIEIDAVNVPAVLIPPLETKASPPLKVYPGDPELTETPSTTDANRIDAYRIQKETFVAVEPGAATISGQDLYWFDGKTLHSATVAAKTITVTGVPKTVSGGNGDRSRRLLIAVLLPAALLIVGYYRYRRRWRDWDADRALRYRRSEAGRFEALGRIAAHGDPIAVYQAFYAWATIAMIDRKPLDFTRITTRYPEAKAAVEMLDQALQDQTRFDAGRFMRAMARLRPLVIRTRRHRQYALIDSLNPR